MFSHIKYSAIAVGLFVLVLVALLVFLITLSLSSYVFSDDNKSIATIYVFAIFAIRMVSFLAAGYITAKLAKTQPLLHGLICGCLGAVFSTFFAGNLFLSLFIVLPAVVTGAWLQKRRSNATPLST
ncbi:MAG: hypothetical protein Q7K57_07335 [Burkholderiaceae bacterium]|nr:hypothetical protein [Burkholderiaceae bacterium]